MPPWHFCSSHQKWNLFLLPLEAGLALWLFEHENVVMYVSSLLILDFHSSTRIPGILFLIHKPSPAPWGWETSWKERSSCPDILSAFPKLLLWVRFSGTSQLPAGPQWLQSTSKPSWVHPTPRLLIYGGLEVNKWSCFKSLKVGDDLFTDNWHNIAVIHMTKDQSS